MGEITLVDTVTQRAGVAKTEKAVHTAETSFYHYYEENCLLWGKNRPPW